VKLLIPIVAAISIASLWRETNSHAAAKRGQRAFAKQDYAAAVKSYQTAKQQAPSARGAFNLGTSQIAGGDREKGSATLADAVKDPVLRADSLFNRGNSALAAKAYEHAIRDYSDALRTNPHHAAAKRNLEIAMQRRASEQQKQSGAGGQQKQPNQQQAQTPQPKPAPKEGEADAEALLRSVQQQEQEELRRMKMKRGDGRVGW
jgi:tetratricopeptide (TPR) repeat protein